MSTDPAKDPTTAVSIKQQTPAGWRADSNNNHTTFDTARTSALMMPMGDDENDEGGGGGNGGSVWKKVAFFAGMAAASLIVFWYFSLRMSFAQKMNEEFINAAGNLKVGLQKNLPIPIDVVLENYPFSDFKAQNDFLAKQGQSTQGKEQSLLEAQIEFLARQGQSTQGKEQSILEALLLFILNPDFVRMVLVVICSIALAPAIKCKSLKLLALVTFIGIALSFLIMNIQQIVDLAAFFNDAAAMKEYLAPLQNLRTPTRTTTFRPRSRTMSTRSTTTRFPPQELPSTPPPIIVEEKELAEIKALLEKFGPNKMLMAMCFIQLLIVFFLFVALLATVITGFIAHSGDLTTTSDDNETSADGGGPATKMLTTTTNTAMLPSGMQMQPSGPRAKPPSTMQTMDATYDRLAFG